MLSLSLIAAPDSARLETREVEGYEFTLGRGHDVDWSLLDPDRNILSRRHCVILREDDDWFVEDLSGNGTFLNHATTPIGIGSRQRLRDGDRVRLGPYEFQVRLDQSGSPSTSSPYMSAPSFAGPSFDGPSLSDSTDDGWKPPPPARSDTGGSPFGDDDTAEPPPAVPPSARSEPSAAAAGGNPFFASEASDWDEPTDSARDASWPPTPPSPAPTAADWPPRGVPLSAQPDAAAVNPFNTQSDAPKPTASAASVAAPPVFPPSPTTGLPPAEPTEAEPPRAGSGVGAPVNPFAEARDSLTATPGASVRVADPPPPTGVPGADPSHRDRPIAAPSDPSPVPSPPVVGRAEPVSDRLLAALLDGAGLPDAKPRDPEQMMRAVGEAFRAMVKGVRDAQRARRSVRGEFRIAQTSFTQNPLKVAVSDEDALEALLGAGRRSAMPADRAVEEILREIVQHEMATFAAMQDAVRVLVDSLDPDRLRAQADQAGGLTVLPAQRKARAWDVYEAEHTRVSEALRDDFDSVFGKAFARAYERVMSEQGS